MEARKKRYCLIDGIRGFAVVNMVVFHFLYDVFIVYWEEPVLVWTSCNPHLAADDMPDLYFYFWICMEVGDGGKSVAWSAVQYVWFYYFVCYPYCYTVGNHLVRDIKFYGMCSPADVPAPKGGKKSISDVGIGNLFCAVYSLQADTVWLYWDWGRYAGPGSILFYKDSDTAWLPFSGISVKRLFPSDSMDVSVSVRVFFQ